MERKKRNAATIAIAMCVPFERSGLVEGKIPEASVQTISTKTTNQLQLTPNSIPAIRPRRKLLPIRSVSHQPHALHLGTGPELVLLADGRDAPDTPRDSLRHRERSVGRHRGLICESQGGGGGARQPPAGRAGP